MNIDPFGHIAAAMHFQQAARKRGWIDEVKRIEQRIKSMEKAEMEYQIWMRS